MKTIAVDIDDVLAMSARGFIAFSNDKWATNLNESDFNEDLGLMWNVDHDEIVRRLKIYFASDIAGTFLPIEGAQSALRELATDYKLIALTSRVQQMMPITNEWIQSHFHDISLEIYSAGIWDKLEKGAHKHTKSDMCLELGVDYLIDDQLKHCIAASEVGVRSILYGNYPWNQSGSLPEGVERAKDWRAVTEYFKSDRS